MWRDVGVLLEPDVDLDACLAIRCKPLCIVDVVAVGSVEPRVGARLPGRSCQNDLPIETGRSRIAPTGVRFTRHPIRNVVIPRKHADIPLSMAGPNPRRDSRPPDAVCDALCRAPFRSFSKRRRRQASAATMSA